MNYIRFTHSSGGFQKVLSFCGQDHCAPGFKFRKDQATQILAQEMSLRWCSRCECFDFASRFTSESWISYERAGFRDKSVVALRDGGSCSTFNCFRVVRVATLAAADLDFNVDVDNKLLLSVLQRAEVGTTRNLALTIPLPEPETFTAALRMLPLHRYRDGYYYTYKESPGQRTRRAISVNSIS